MGEGRSSQEESVEKPCELRPGTGRGGPKTERHPEGEKTEQENIDDKREAEREKAKRTEREREEGNQVRAGALGGGRGRRKRIRERKQKKRREQLLCC